MPAYDHETEWTKQVMCVHVLTVTPLSPSASLSSLTLHLRLIPSFLSLFQVASDCIWSDPASEVMERSLDETGFGDSPRGGGAVW
jgi:hypothetical protein